jgi:hypothetical protein
MRPNTGFVRLSLCRLFVIAMLSTCLINAPLWNLRTANAATRGVSRQAENLQVPPPATVTGNPAAPVTD